MCLVSTSCSVSPVQTTSTVERETHFLNIPQSVSACSEPSQAEKKRHTSHIFAALLTARVWLAAQLSAQHRRLLHTPRTPGAHRSPLPFVLHLQSTGTAAAPVHQPHVAAACHAIWSVRGRTGRCNLQDSSLLENTCQYCPTGTNKDPVGGFSGCSWGQSGRREGSR